MIISETNPQPLPPFEGQEDVCNWCGSQNLKQETRVFGCDLWHDVYRCQDCLRFTWHHIYWHSCEQTSPGHYVGL